MRSQSNGRDRAFTLIELLVVIGIVAVLMGIGIAVGIGVTNSSRANATQNTIQVLETYLSDLDNSGQSPSAYRTFAVEVSGQNFEFPVVDGRVRGQGPDRSDPAISSLMRFLKAGDVYLGESSSRWSGLDSSQIRESDLATAGGEAIRGVELLDQWGSPIRAVHPAYDGGFGNFWNATSSPSLASRDTLRVSAQSGGAVSILQVSRSYRPFNPTTATGEPIGDADEGICPNERVYFYSAGPDGDPGTREDNVYGAVRPQFPVETADFE